MYDMAKLERSDCIKSLILFRFGPTGAGSGLGLPRPNTDLIRDRQDAIKRYGADLAKKTDDELRALVDQELIKKQWAELKRRVSEEKALWFNKPESRGNVTYWAKTSYWKLDEGVALILARDPMKVSYDSLKLYKDRSAFARKYCQYYELANRARTMKQLSSKNLPGFFIAWAKRSRLRVDRDLEIEIQKYGHQVADWKTLYDQVNRELDKVTAEYASFREEQTRTAAAGSPLKKSKSAETRRTNTLLKIIAGVAFDVYGWRPGISGSAPKDIEDATNRIGARVSEDTVRNTLADAADFVDDRLNE